MLVPFLLAALVLILVSTAHAASPSNRTYFTVFLGLPEPLSWLADCVSFSRDEICFGDEVCGTWTLAESGPDGELSFQIESEVDGDPVYIEGRARFETRARRDALGGTAHLEGNAQTFNFAFNGRSVQPSRCTLLVEEFGLVAQGADQ